MALDSAMLGAVALATHMPPLATHCCAADRLVEIPAKLLGLIFAHYPGRLRSWTRVRVVSWGLLPPGLLGPHSLHCDHAQGRLVWQGALL